MNTKCRKCGSENISGLINPFWVDLINDEPKTGWDNQVASETELGDARRCRTCGFEWKET